MPYSLLSDVAATDQAVPYHPISFTLSASSNPILLSASVTSLHMWVSSCGTCLCLAYLQCYPCCYKSQDFISWWPNHISFCACTTLPLLIRSWELRVFPCCVCLNSTAVRMGVQRAQEHKVSLTYWFHFFYIYAQEHISWIIWPLTFTKRTYIVFHTGITDFYSC